MMLRTMFELLSYIPVEYIEDKESRYVKLILEEQQIPQGYEYYDELFAGFCSYVKEGLVPLRKQESFDKNELAWLREWKQKYHGDYDNDRKTYPVLFKKMCYYIIVRRNISDEAFCDAIDFKVKMIANWKIYTRYTKRTMDKTHVELPVTRNGKKVKYLTDAISDMYFECHRQKFEKAPEVQNLPMFADVFGGTATVAASIDISSEKKIINEFDATMLCMLCMLRDHKEAVVKKLIDFHNEAMLGTFCEQNWYTSEDFERQFEKNTSYADANDSKNFERKLHKFQTLYSVEYWERATLPDYENREAYIQDVKKRIEFTIKARNLFLFCEDKVKKANIGQDIFKGMIPNGDNIIKGCESIASTEELIEIAACYLFYSSFNGTFGGNEPDETGVDEKHYCDYLRAVFGVQIDADAEAILNERLVYKKSMLNISEWKKRVKSSWFVNFSFEDIFKLENMLERDVFYYLDSPYYLTKQYHASFTDEQHKDMLDVLRSGEFNWIFSMQYYKGAYNNPKANKRGKIKIKDYYTYYTGFVAPFMQAGNEYISTYVKEAPIRDLYVVLFDFSKLPDTTVKFKSEGNEMFVTNFDSNSAFSYDSPYVQLPFWHFLKYADDGMDYIDIVEKARHYREVSIRGYLK